MIAEESFQSSESDPISLESLRLNEHLELGSSQNPHHSITPNFHELDLSMQSICSPPLDNNEELSVHRWSSDSQVTALKKTEENLSFYRWSYLMICSSIKKKIPEILLLRITNRYEMLKVWNMINYKCDQIELGITPTIPYSWVTDIWEIKPFETNQV